MEPTPVTFGLDVSVASEALVIARIAEEANKLPVPFAPE
jgi:hypothetical protein